MTTDEPSIGFLAAFNLKMNTVDGLDYDDIQGLTNNFSEDNFIGNFQFGKLYHGMCKGKPFTVKIWRPNERYTPKPGDNESRLRDEINLLTYFHNTPSHGCLPKLAGYCTDAGHLAIVYRLSAINTLKNLLSEEGFSWKQRIKVAFGCASVLQFLHEKHPAFPYLIRNVDPAHVLIDEDCNPILYEFSMITGGMITDRTHLHTPYVFGCYGTSDPGCIKGVWTDKCDVFAYGCMLLGLIMARICTYQDSRNEVFLHKNLEAGPLFNPNDALKITELAQRCMDIDTQRRPSMKQVVECLQQLHVILLHTDELEIHKMILDDQEELKHRMRKYPEFRPLPMGGNDGIHPKSCFMLRPHKLKRKLSDDSLYTQAGRQHGEIEVLATKDLSSYTNGFSKANIIGKFQFGTLYHGSIDGRKVTVKIWEGNEMYYFFTRKLNEARQRDELDLLQHPELLAQPNVVKVIGYCHEEECLGIVYDLDSLDSVRNLIFKDSFTWLQRVKVIVGFARFLSFLQAPHPPHYSYLIHNIDANHIMVDQDYNSKLVDFGMISGGIFADRSKDYGRVNNCFGYIDTEYSVGHPWTEKCEVYAFGILVFSMIAKRTYTKEDPTYVDVWAEKERKSKMEEFGADVNNISLVHQSLEADKDFCCDDGALITRLAFKCVECFTGERPSINQVVNQLLDLRVVQKMDV